MPGTALWVDGFICLPVSPFICLPLSPRLDAWHGSLGGRVRLSPWVHLSPFVSLHLSPVVSHPVWVDGFICLPSFVSRCLPAWMPGTALWVDGFICLPLSPFICLPAWMPARLGFICLPLSPFICLPLSPSLDAWVDRFTCLPSLGWRGSFVSLCLPSFVSRCLPAWMPGTALWVDGFICHPLSPFICLPLPPSLDACHGCLGGWVHLSPFVSLHLSGTALWALFPFICLPLSPSLDVWHGSPGGQIHLSPFVSLHLSPVVSQPGCLARLFGWTVSLVSLCLPSFGSPCLPAWMSVTALQADGFTCLPFFPSLDGFICLPLSPFVCLPLSPSLDAWHGSLGGRIHLSPVVSQPGCVALTLRGFLHFPRFCPFGGVWFAFGFGPHSLSCGCWGQGPLSALHLDFDFAWARGGSSSLSIVGYTLSVRSVPRYQLLSLSLLAFGVPS